MMFFQETNSLLNEYLKITGKPASSVSSDDYLKFRQCVLNEYMMGVPMEDVSSQKNDMPTPLGTQKNNNAGYPEQKQPQKVNTVPHEGNIPPSIPNNEIPKNKKKNTENKARPYNTVVKENKKDKMMSMMKQIQG